MARGKRALLIALLVAASLLAGIGATARELWLEAREVEIDLHQGAILALAALGSDAVVCARGDGTVEAIQVSGGHVRWRVRFNGGGGVFKMVEREGFVAMGCLPYSGGSMTPSVGRIAVLRDGQVVAEVAPDRHWLPMWVDLLPSQRPGGARLAWIETDDGCRVHARELTGEPDERIVQVAESLESLAVSGNRLFALGSEGLLSFDIWTLKREKVADTHSAGGLRFAAGPRGVAWGRGVSDHGIDLWRPGTAPVEILEDYCWCVAFDDSGELLAAIHGKRDPREDSWFSIGLYDLESERWWTREIPGARGVAFVGDRLVVGDTSGKLTVLATPRARFQRSWKPLVR